VHKNDNSTLNSFSVIALCYFSNLIFVQIITQKPLRYQYETLQMEISHSGGVQCTIVITLPFVIFELLPFVIFHTSFSRLKLDMVAELCPFHFEKTFSFSVNYLSNCSTHSTQIWHMDTFKECRGQVPILLWFNDFWQSNAPSALRK
jgi:hypothetical protein